MSRIWIQLRPDQMLFSGLLELIICQVSLTCIQRITVLVSHRKFRKLSCLQWQNPRWRAACDLLLCGADGRFHSCWREGWKVKWDRKTHPVVRRGIPLSSTQVWASGEDGNSEPLALFVFALVSFQLFNRISYRWETAAACLPPT